MPIAPPLPPPKREDIPSLPTWMALPKRNRTRLVSLLAQLAVRHLAMGPASTGEGADDR